MSTPWPVGATGWYGSGRRVVAGPQDDRVLGNTGSVDGVENLTGPVVEFSQGVRVGAATGLAGELRVGHEGWVHLGEADVGEERPPGFGVVLDEVGGALGDVLIHERPSLIVEVRNFCHWRSGHTLPNLRHLEARVPEQRVRRIGGLVRGVLDPEPPLVEALISG